jgi:hypothetical protein
LIDWLGVWAEWSGPTHAPSNGKPTATATAVTHAQIISSLEEAGGNKRGGEDDDGIERGGSSASGGGGGGGGAAGEKGGCKTGVTSALERAKSLTLGGASAKAKDIPTPQIDTVADYEALVEANYKLPDSYIRTKKLPQILPPGGA